MFNKGIARLAGKRIKLWKGLLVASAVLAAGGFLLGNSSVTPIKKTIVLSDCYDVSHHERNVTLPDNNVQEQQKSSEIREDRVSKQRQINAVRLQHVREACEVLKDKMQLRMNSEAFVTRNPMLVYCFIPKNACTNLKRFLRFVSGDYDHSKLVESPEDIPRLYAHFGPWKFTKKVLLSEQNNVETLNKEGYKFMVARDPYTRLWSGYVDKFLLPDFWHVMGRKMIQAVRPTVQEKSRICGYDLTFTEFLKNIANNLEHHRPVDMHFKPSYTRCNPCVMKFDTIAKIETFSDDFKLILSDTNLTHVTARANQSIDRSLEEMKMLTYYNFNGQDRWIKNRSKPECFVQLDIAKRIWKAFQINGYLGDNFEFPEEGVKNIDSRDGVRDYLVNCFTEICSHTNATEREKWKSQRKKYLKKAYLDVPVDIRGRIRDAFKIDFELFGYEKEPDFVFPK